MAERLPGELSQVLPSPRHFEQASSLVTAESVGGTFASGPDPQRQFESIEQYRKAGFDELYVANVGPHYRELIDLYRREVLPQLGS